MNTHKIKLITAIVVGALALVLILLNTDAVTIHLIFAKVTMSLVVFSLVMLGLGFLAGILMGWTMIGSRGSTRSK